MMQYFSILIVMTILGAAASLFLKRASGTEGIRGLFLNRNLYTGAFLYLAAAILNIWLLRKLDYSVVLPLTSLTYIWTMLLSRFFLRERITARKIGGVTLILVGAIFVSL